MAETADRTDQCEIFIESAADSKELFGSLDGNIRRLCDYYNVEIIQRQDAVLVRGERAEAAAAVLNDLLQLLKDGETLDRQKVDYILNLRDSGLAYSQTRKPSGVLCFTHKGKPVRPKTFGQAEYAAAIRENDLVFGIGPAGTGKTYIAVAMAVQAYKSKDVERIILARPAVEAGERLGFLPGDLQEKVDPYLRPLYDALYDILGRDATLRLKEREVIEIVPLAYMRGRTLDRSFVILDEAQNTTGEQMKMFLTRLGNDSKAVVNGDITQIDLPKGRQSGLVIALEVLAGVEGLAFSHLKEADVVRHPLVRRIIRAYQVYEESRPEAETEKSLETEKGLGTETEEGINDGITV
ncbi:MAG TPA: PhoH family protein [Clostridiales bacterium]|jgi:phosphate starvation-inducible PhoH-like protein|nr:PhoH family protein [Clostridiales bacterium]